jgi:coenzyme PQQ precursor peptide PqqA
MGLMVAATLSTRAVAARVAHENHESTFMIRRKRRDAGVLHGRAVHYRSVLMKWETPQATDFRFGMEITMYIAKR